MNYFMFFSFVLNLQNLEYMLDSQHNLPGTSFNYVFKVMYSWTYWTAHP